MTLLASGHLGTDFANGALPALLPFLVDRFDLSYTLAATLMLASAVSSSVIQPLFGLWSDRGGASRLRPVPPQLRTRRDAAGAADRRGSPRRAGASPRRHRLSQPRLVRPRHVRPAVGGVARPLEGARQPAALADAPRGRPRDD